MVKKGRLKLVLPPGRNAKYHSINPDPDYRQTDCGWFIADTWRVEVVDKKFVTVWGCVTCAQVRRRRGHEIVLPSTTAKYHTVSTPAGRTTDCGRFIADTWRRAVDPKYVSWGCKTCAQVRRG